MVSNCWYQQLTLVTERSIILGACNERATGITADRLSPWSSLAHNRVQIRMRRASLVHLPSKFNPAALEFEWLEKARGLCGYVARRPCSCRGRLKSGVRFGQQSVGTAWGTYAQITQARGRRGTRIAAGAPRPGGCGYSLALGDREVVCLFVCLCLLHGMPAVALLPWGRLSQGTQSTPGLRLKKPSAALQLAQGQYNQLLLNKLARAPGSGY